jgi:electron transport complex protein RnfA
MNLLSIFVAAAIVNNFVFYRFLGICAFLGVSKRLRPALSMGGAVTFVMVISSFTTSLIKTYFLDKFGLPYLIYGVYILVIAALVQIIEMFMKKKMLAMYKIFGIYLPLITTNCTILGVVLLNDVLGYGLIQSIIFSVGAGLGYTMALAIMAGIRERLELADIPEPLQGVPIALIIAGLLALAFDGFSGMI